MGKLLFFLTTLLCIMTVCFTVAVSVSPQWMTVYLNPMVVRSIVKLSPPSELTDLYDDITKQGMMIGSGICKTALWFGKISHEVYPQITLEGAFILSGLSVFCIGVMLHLSTGFLMNGSDLKLSSPVTKVLAKGSSIFLRIGSGILLSGMVAFTINHVKDNEQNYDYHKLLVEITSHIQQTTHYDVTEHIQQTTHYDVTEHVTIDYDLINHMLECERSFGWCFYLGWSAGACSLIAGVMAWAISDEMGKVTRNDFHYPAVTKV